MDFGLLEAQPPLGTVRQISRQLSWLAMATSSGRERYDVQVVDEIESSTGAPLDPSNQEGWSQLQAKVEVRLLLPRCKAGY